MATHSSILAWRIPGTGDPGGLSSMGPHRVVHEWSDLAAVLSTLLGLQHLCLLPLCLTKMVLDEETIFLGGKISGFNNVLHIIPVSWLYKRRRASLTSYWIYSFSFNSCALFSFPVGTGNPPANSGDVRDEVLIPGSGRPPGSQSGTRSSILARRIPWTEEPGGPRGRKGSDMTEWLGRHACALFPMFSHAGSAPLVK